MVSILDLLGLNILKLRVVYLVADAHSAARTLGAFLNMLKITKQDK